MKYFASMQTPWMKLTSSFTCENFAEIYFCNEKKSRFKYKLSWDYKYFTLKCDPLKCKVVKQANVTPLIAAGVTKHAFLLTDATTKKIIFYKRLFVRAINFAMKGARVEA